MRNGWLVWAVIAPLGAGCVGSDVIRRDASADRADVTASADVARPDGTTGPEAGPDATSRPDAGADAGGDGASTDAAPDVACRTMCGGSCTDTTTDPRNCGACFRDCANLPGVDPAAARCVAGLCVIGTACMPNRGDCNRDAMDGCETDLGTTSNCGRCGTSCSEPTPICTMMAGDGGPASFRCGSGCVSPTPDRCTGRCVDLQTDPRNCGTCGTVCPAATNAAAACVAGRCTLACATGFGDCDGSAVNGCETSTRTSPTHCGTCGNVCPGVMGGLPACNAGVCGIACAPGTADCDMMSANACEVTLASNPMHCGVCGNACPTRPNATAACTTGVCSFTCAMGFGNCNGLTSDGCEVDLQSNPLNCGACARRCSAVANGTATCASSTCGFACLPGFGDCNSNGLDGCEVSIASSPLHCGRCGNACPTPTNATASCAAGTCGAACNPGFGNCDGDLTNGCEVNTNTSMSHCGGCGRVCVPVAQSTAACVAGACILTCNAGYTLSGGACVRSPPVPATPWAGAVVTTLRPVFRVVLGAGQDDAEIEICGNRACTLPAVAPFRLMATGGRPAANLIPGVYYWRATGVVGGAVATTPGVVQQFTVSATAGASGGGQWGSTINPNGDGIAEVAVGAPVYAQAYVRGSSTLASSFLSVSGASGFGTSVGSAGDVNGDGFVDVLVGAPSATGGTVAVFQSNGGSYGVATTTLASPPGVVRFGAVVTGVGDLNRDGYSDIAVATGSNRVFVFNGGPTGVSATSSATLNDPSGAMGLFGSAIATGCDVDADGYGDVIVGINGPANAFYVYRGGAMGVASTPVTVAGPVAGTGFGTTVQCAGDVNADGYVDVAVGSPGNNRVYVFSGGPTGLATTPASTLGASFAVSQLGSVLSYAGDVDGDGVGDLLAGSPSTGVLRLFWGNAAGISDTDALSLASLGGVNGFSSVTAADVFTEAGVVRFDVIVGRPATSVHLYRWAGSRASLTFQSSLSILTGAGTVVAAH
jgi:hypothetical protein